MIHPWQGDPAVNIISLSYTFADDLNSPDFGTPTFHALLTSLFQDAQMLGITVIAAAGDAGSRSSLGPADGQAYVQLPGIHPLVLSAGGTVVGNINGANFEEYVWNDASGATGGGVSRNYPVPSYQTAIAPRHVNTGVTGRGIPDITGEASPASGLIIWVDGVLTQSGGTSQTTPLFAGLIAVINAAIGKNVGFINPVLYANPGIFRDITASTLGPPNNAFNGATGYNVGTGWDGSTGLGGIDGGKMLTVLQAASNRHPALSYSDDGGGAKPIPSVTDNSFGFTHPALPVGTHTIQILANNVVSGTATVTVQAPVTPGTVQNMNVVATSNSLTVTWYPPVVANPPFTYSIAWSTSTTNFPNAAAATSPYFIPGLSGGPWFVLLTATGPTGLVGQGVLYGPVPLA